MPSAVIVTRPAIGGERLRDRLSTRGADAAWWPAFDIGPAPDVDAARRGLARLAAYDLAIFVSANAVSATHELLADKWPTRTTIGAVGASTAHAVRIEWQLDSRTRLIAPNDDHASGSEAFWRAWSASGLRAQKVLLLRAEEGRDWLAEQFTEAGATVEAIAVYSRRPHWLSAEDLAQLEKWVRAGVQPIVIVSSSEAVSALDQQVSVIHASWLRTGTAIAMHARIAERLKDAGFPCVVISGFDDDGIIATVESLAR